jgi:hypothetical protein
VRLYAGETNAIEICFRRSSPQGDEVKPRHAAALALVGWYLMAPPVLAPKNEPPYLNEHAEYQDWQKLKSFDSQEHCEDGRKRAKQSTAKGEILYFAVVDVDPGPWLAQQDEAECIATDDPRLKEKK